MDIDRRVAVQKAEDASKKVGKIHTSVSELQFSMRNKSIDFYYKLSLLSGGVLSLSITYIGYLSSVSGGRVMFAELLYSSWALLLIAIFSSLYRNHFNLNMGHYQTLNVLNKARLEEFEASLEILEKYPEQFANLKTHDDVARQMRLTKKNIRTLKRAITKVAKKEKRESSLWVLTQKMSHISFFVGMVLITIFAGVNLPVKVDFTLLEMLTKGTR